MEELIKELLKQGYLVEPALIEFINKSFNFAESDTLLKILIQLGAPKLLSKTFFLANINQINQLLPDRSKIAVEENKEIEENNEKEKGAKIEENNEKEKDGEETSSKSPKPQQTFIKRKNVLVFEPEFSTEKIEVKDFSNYFKNRFLTLKSFIQERRLEGLTSISKLPSTRTKHTISIIGLVYSMRITKNKNLLVEIEDQTGKVPVVINKNKEELIEKSQNIVLDEVIGIQGVGSREILFANDVIFPDIALSKIKNSPVENYAAFTADVHLGSDKFLEKNFARFLKWLNGGLGSESQRELSKKIKYLFIVGDIVDGVGVYPGQEKELKIHSVYEQYSKLAKMLKEARDDITIILSPGNLHDAVRTLEPQPIIPKEVAPELHEMKNVVMTTNPSRVKIEKTDSFEGINILMYHGGSYDYYADGVDFLRQNNAKLRPDKIIHFLLKKRHLAPSHGSAPAIPFEKDSLLIKNAPDIFVSGHVHKSAISQYNGIKTISCSCWQSKTAYQEKFGHEPDPCKVPILNLKTGKITVLDFS